MIFHALQFDSKTSFRAINNMKNPSEFVIFVERSCLYVVCLAKRLLNNVMDLFCLEAMKLFS